jgi:uncharacterized protein
MNRSSQIKEVEEFTRQFISGYDGGHDWWHLKRVRNLALYIQKKEKKGNRFVIELSALLHDIGDSKFINAERKDYETEVFDLLDNLDIDKSIIEEVIFINRNISFSKGLTPAKISHEFMIVQDADRLDAIGAIGIARAFNYGGFINNSIYDPDGKEPSTIRHFYDKLLKLKDLMNTPTGQMIAMDRHNFLELFLDQFYNEWHLDDKRE